MRRGSSGLEVGFCELGFEKEVAEAEVYLGLVCEQVGAVEPMAGQVSECGAQFGASLARLPERNAGCDAEAWLGSGVDVEKISDCGGEGLAVEDGRDGRRCS